MDSRINTAAAALPKLEGLIKVRFMEWTTSPGDIKSYDEELFYDEKTKDIYVALTITTKVNRRVTEKSLIVRITAKGLVELLESAELIELDLEDITHLSFSIAKKVIDAMTAEKTLKSALKTSIVLNDVVVHN